MTYVAANAPGCYTAGNYEYWYCAACQIYYKDAIGTTAYTDENGQPTKDIADVTIPATAHKDENGESILVKTEANAPTCTGKGNKTYWYCSACKIYFKDAEASEAYSESDPYEIAALGHTYEDDDLENDRLETYQNATCLVDGVLYRYCGNDGCSEYKEETIEARGSHDYVLTDSKDAACEEEGYKTYTCQNAFCNDEDGLRTYTDTFDALEHEWGLNQLVTGPSCENETDGEGWFYCPKCKRMELQTIQWAHTWIAAEKVEPTCTEAGHESGYVCSVCKDTDSTTLILPALGQIPPL